MTGGGYLYAGVGLKVASVVAYFELGLGPHFGVVADDDGFGFLSLVPFFFFSDGDGGDQLVDSLDELSVAVMPVCEPIFESDEARAVDGFDASVSKGIAFIIALFVRNGASALFDVNLFDVPFDFP